MALLLTLVTRYGDPALKEARARVKDFQSDHPRILSMNEAFDVPVALTFDVARQLEGLPVDWALQNAEGRRKRLLIADMDSTIIGQECLDELADLAGVGDEVAAITEKAMRGEIPFEAALRERVKMITGLPLSELQRCYDLRVSLNPGAQTLTRTMRSNGAFCALVSGGFTFFTERVAADAGFDAHRANRLLDNGRALTGLVTEPILGREAKAAALANYAAGRGLGPSEAMAIGDGANDLEMLKRAGVGVAFKAKPVVASQTSARIDHTTLETALFFQGYSRDAFLH
jgi:phosphoserine phosphatase